MSRVIGSIEELAELAEDWARLLAVTPCGSGFQAHGWIATCWQFLRHRGARLHVLAAEREGQIAGILPLQLSPTGGASFIGASVSNYSGPVVDPSHAPDVTAEWLDEIAADRTIRSVDFANLREGDAFLDALRSWRPRRGGAPRIALMNVCPELDLTPGWETVYRRHGSGRRSSWRTRARRLEALGRVSFEETTEAEAIRAALPDMVRLWNGRWGGRWTSGVLSPSVLEFQSAACGSGVELLSTLHVDGRLIAFCLGVRLGAGTTGYVMAHDDRLAPYSPGLLLLLRMLEAAGQRCDQRYDFSLGKMSYKALWADSERSVYHALWGRGSRLRASRQRLWVSLRSIDWLRDLKVEGPHWLRTHLPRRSAGGNLVGPSDGATWTIWRPRTELPPVGVVRSELGFVDMERRLSPAAFRRGLERAFRGDRLVALSVDDRELGMAWLAGQARSDAIAAACRLDLPAGQCWYEPACADGASVAELAAALLTSPNSLLASLRPLADPRFEPIGNVAADSRPGQPHAGRESR